MTIGGVQGALARRFVQKQIWSDKLEMPQNRKPLYRYPPGHKPLGQLTINGATGFVYGREADFVKRLAMLRTARKFLKPSMTCTSDEHRSVILAVLVGDCFEIALAPTILTDGNHPGTTKRFLNFFAHNTDFAMKYLACLRQAASNAHCCATAKAADALRNLETVTVFGGRKRIPIADATDKDIAQAIGVSPGAVYHARRALNLFDSRMWGESMKPKKRKRI